MAKQVNGAIYYGIGLDNNQLRADAMQSQRILQGIGNTAVAEGARIDNTLRKLILPAGIAVAAQQLASSVRKVRGEMQMLEKSFDVLLQDEEKSVKMLAEIRRLSTESPLEMTHVSSAVQTLLGFGVEADKVMNIVRQLSDVSMGNSQRFQSLALVYAQVQSAGKLMGQDLLQMINAGFNPLQVIAEQTGKSIGVLKEEMSAGTISAQMVADAFTKVTTEGGKFYQMTQKQSEGLVGLEASLNDAVTMMQNELGKASEDIIAGSLKAATALVENYEKVGKILIGLVATYGAYRAALIFATAATKGWTAAELIHFNVLVIVEKAQKLLNRTMLANPYVLITTLVVGLVAALWALRDSSTAAERAQERLNKRQAEFNEQEQSRRSHIEELIRVIQDETQTLYAQITAYEELEKLSPALTKAYTREQLAVAELTEANKALNVEQDKRNADKLVSDIDNTRKSIAKLKEEYQLMASIPEQSGFTLLRIAKQIEEQEAGLAILQRNLADHNRRVAEAEFNALPPAEKIRIKEEQLERIRSEFERVNAVINEEVAKLPQEVQIPLRVNVTGEQQPQEWRPYSSTPGTLWGPQSLGVQQARADSLRSEEQALTAEIDALRATNETKTVISEEERKRLAEEARRRREQAQRDADALKKLEVQFADAVAQARIDALEDGLQKTLDQNELNFQRELAQIEEQKRELLAARQKTLPQGQTATLTTDEQAGFTARNNAAETERDRANREARQTETDRLNAMLKDYQTYQQRMTEIAEKYEKERENVRAAGGGEENIALVNEAEQNAVDALDLEYAQKESTFRAWMNQLATQTLDELTATLAAAEKALADAEAAGGSGQALATAKARVNQARVAVQNESEKAATETDAEKQYKSWQKLYSTLQKVASEFDEIGEAVGGVAGEVIKTAGNIATSALSGISAITQLANWSVTATQMAAQGASAAIISVEKASVILAVIGAVMQVIQAIVNAIVGNADKAIKKRIEALEKQIDELEERLENPEFFRLLDEGSLDFVDKVVAEFQRAKDEIDNMFVVNVRGMTIQINNAEKTQMQLGLLNTSVSGLSQGFLELGYNAGAAFGDVKFDNVRAQLDAISQQILLMEEAIRENESRKKKNREDMSQTVSSIALKEQQALMTLTNAINDILDSTSDDIATDLGDALLEAFKAGEDGAKAWADTVNDLIQGITRRMMVEKFISGPLSAIIDKYSGKWYDKEGNFAGIDYLLSTLPSLESEINALGDTAVPIFEQIFKNMGIGQEQLDREASKKGIATASQESVDENNGRLTAIQGHTFSLMESVKILVANNAQILEHLAGINRSTARLEAIEEDIHSMRFAINDIALKGVKMRTV